MMENTSWLKDAIQHIQETALPVLVENGGHHYRVSPNGEITELLPMQFHPQTMELYSLDSLVRMVESEAVPSVGAGGIVYLNIPDHLTVRCFTQPDPEARYYRHVFYEAKATDVPGWGEKVQLPFEEMQVALRTRFQETSDTPYVQKLLSDISTGAKITYNDNGVATTIVTSKGVALQGSETIRPIVTLRPYRTFQEVEQPDSTFLIRVSERGISFTEADGGMWRLRARQTVREFLNDRLAVLIESGRVIVSL